MKRGECVRLQYVQSRLDLDNSRKPYHDVPHEEGLN